MCVCVCVCVCVCACLPYTHHGGPRDVVCCAPTVAARREIVTSSLKLGSSVRAPLTDHSRVDPVRLPPLLCCRVKGGRDTLLELFALSACFLSLENGGQQSSSSSFRRSRLDLIHALHFFVKDIPVFICHSASRPAVEALRPLQRYSG